LETGIGFVAPDHKCIYILLKIFCFQALFTNLYGAILSKYPSNCDD
jgi:hypothetical protein